LLVYIHIAYCDSKCHYCSFNSYVDKFDTREKYMLSLKEELMFELDKFEVKKESIETIFIGGGTPSTIKPKLYEPIFNILSPFMTKDIEITTEANPNSASKEWLEGMRDLGVNRVSFGVQSFNNNKLKELNRSHCKDEAINAINNAKDIGIENISLDLIYNYKGDTKELLLNDINQAFKLPINHISAYELTIEENTHFFKTPKVRQDNEELAFFVKDEIEKRGFKAYEISNFGSYQSRHNKGYWELKDYIGIGCGAVGFKKDRRFYTQKDIDKYIKNPLDREIEILSKEDILTEKIFLGLRSIIGIDKNILDKDMIQKADFLVQKDKLKYENNRYYNLDFFISDEIALYILE